MCNAAYRIRTDVSGVEVPGNDRYTKAAQNHYPLIYTLFLITKETAPIQHHHLCYRWRRRNSSSTTLILSSSSLFLATAAPRAAPTAIPRAVMQKYPKAPPALTTTVCGFICSPPYVLYQKNRESCGK